MGASAAAGIDPPLGPVHPDFRDLDRYRADTEQLLLSGFGERCCSHPGQVTVVNEVFTPARLEVDEAATVVARYDEATAAGEGVIVGNDGTMIDEAYVRTARRVL
ncbi:MAG: CoA ester lyase, partial [Acidimicrobiia bacterium]